MRFLTSFGMTAVLAEVALVIPSETKWSEETQRISRQNILKYQYHEIKWQL